MFAHSLCASRVLFFSQCACIVQAQKTKACKLCNLHAFLCLAEEEGFEPSHAGIKIRCLNQLGDSPIIFKSHHICYGVCLFNMHKIKCYACSKNGWYFNPFATNPEVFSGFCCKICCACTSCVTATNTDAPEPLMRACPNWDNHAKVLATAG